MFELRLRLWVCLATPFFDSKSVEVDFFFFFPLLCVASYCFLSHWDSLSNTAVLPAWMHGPIMSTSTVSEACLEGLFFSLVCHQFSLNKYSCAQSLILPMLSCSLISPGSHQTWMWPAHIEELWKGWRKLELMFTRAEQYFLIIVTLRLLILHQRSKSLLDVTSGFLRSIAYWGKSDA